MKKIFLIIALMVFYPVLDRAGSEEISGLVEKTDIYSLLNLSQVGLSNEAYQLGIKGFNHLKENGQLLNSSILTIIDFSQSSNKKSTFTKKRFYLIHMFRMAAIPAMNMPNSFRIFPAHSRAVLVFILPKIWLSVQKWDCRLF